jgi:hypothetical protein
MYTGLLYAHSTLRYVVLLLLVIVIARSIVGWLNKRPYVKADNQFSLWLLIGTHTQFLVGLILYFVSPFVQFLGSTMKDPASRYWTVEHLTMMIIAIVLITVGRISHKKLTADGDKHKRLFIMNALALLIIIVALIASGRGIFRASMMS